MGRLRSDKWEWSRTLGAQLILLLPALWLFLPAFDGRQILAFRDGAHYYYPLWHWMDAEWQAGRPPLWNPQENNGVSLAADPTAGLWYPGQLLLRLPCPFAARFHLFLFVHLIGAAWGAWRVQQQVLIQGPAIRVGLVQGNVPQGQKWDPAFRDAILARYLSLTRDVARQGVDLVIWPESSTPFVFGRDAIATEVMRAGVVQGGVPVVFGSDEVVGPTEFYNAAFVMDATGEIRGGYRKMQLVPFGEYIPVRSVLFFARPLVEGFSDFSAGRELTLLPVGAHRLSVAVCYEAVFPWLAVRAVRQGSQLLTTITNDAWYGTSAAPWQHFQQARVRAVETGRYLVRAANTGISGVVDPYGRVVVQSPLFQTGTWVGEVRWLDGMTPYVRMGDAVAWACMLVTVALLALPWVERFRR